VSVGALAVFFHFAEQRRATTTKLVFAGGGFLYNYRIAETRYGLAMRVVHPVPIGTRLEVTFENPAGGEPFIVTRSLGSDTNLVGVESPALPDVSTGRDYAVVLRLRDRDTNAVLETHERQFRTNVDPAVMPKKTADRRPRLSPQPGKIGRQTCDAAYILKTPKRVSATGALRQAAKARPSTSRVSAGRMMPSSHSRAVA